MRLLCHNTVLRIVYPPPHPPFAPFYRIVSQLVPVTSRARLRHSPVSPLHLAAERNRRSAAAVLLRTGADVNATLASSHSARYADRRATALFFAVASGSTETAALLLEAGASLQLDPVSPLLVAVRRGCVSTAALLLERGADTDVRVPWLGTTFPAALALCMDNLPLLKCLLDHGCDAHSCFACAYGKRPHPRTEGSNGLVLQQQDIMGSLNCNEEPQRATQVRLFFKKGGNNTLQILIQNEIYYLKSSFFHAFFCLSLFLSQFCEWISTSAMCEWAGPIIDLLLEHVGHVQLCSKLTELLDSREEWLAVKRKSCELHTKPCHSTAMQITQAQCFRFLIIE